MNIQTDKRSRHICILVFYNGTTYMSPFNGPTHSLGIIYAVFTAPRSDQNRYCQKGEGVCSIQHIYSILYVYGYVHAGNLSSQEESHAGILRLGEAELPKPHWRTDEAECKIYIVRKRTFGRRATPGCSMTMSPF